MPDTNYLDLAIHAKIGKMAQSVWSSNNEYATLNEILRALNMNPNQG